MSAVKEQAMWGIHAGRRGEADTLFLRHNVIALGWVDMCDLSALPADFEAFKARVVEVYPDSKPGAWPMFAGQLFRFVHAVQLGDFVVYRSKLDQQVHLGRIKGPYVYSTKPEPHYPQHRKVEWLKAFPPTRFSPGALSEIRARLTLFQVQNYAEEFFAALQDKPPPPRPEAEEGWDEEITRDFILKRLAHQLKGYPLQDFVAHVLGCMGYRTRVSPEGPDGGIDIIAHKDELGLQPPIIKVEVKSSEGNIGAPVAAALYGRVGERESGLVVTLGAFTKDARNFERSRSNLRLIDGDDLVALILEHYEQFDSRYKGLIPLKQVYVPEPVVEAED